MTQEAPTVQVSDSPDQDPAALAIMQRDLLARLASASVADAVGLLVRSERHRYYALADLEWLLLPPLALGQIMFAYQRQPLTAVMPDGSEGENGKVAPTPPAPPMATAMLTWALVSPDVGEKIDAQKKAGVPLRIAPQEWRSGKELRIVEAIGPVKDLAALTAKLREQIQAAEAKKGAAA